jgi:hypothetical protein
MKHGKDIYMKICIFSLLPMAGEEVRIAVVRQSQFELPASNTQPFLSNTKCTSNEEEQVSECASTRI